MPPLLADITSNQPCAQNLSQGLLLGPQTAPPFTATSMPGSGLCYTEPWTRESLSLSSGLTIPTVLLALREGPRPQWFGVKVRGKQSFPECPRDTLSHQVLWVPVVGASALHFPEVPAAGVHVAAQEPCDSSSRWFPDKLTGKP